MAAIAAIQMTMKYSPLVRAIILIGLCVPGVALAQNRKVEPILINAVDQPLLRSFVDLKNGKRVTHAISVGSSAQVHYTYDADNGKLILLWRGGFLDATPMWHDRGDGSSRPLGKAIQFGDAIPEIQKLSSPQSPLKMDTTGSGFRQKGYTLDNEGLPTFKYTTFGLSVKDATRVLEGAKGIRRQIELQGPADDLYICLASANKIEKIGKGEYAIDDTAYLLKLDDLSALQPKVRSVGGRKELLVPVSKKISYSILFNK